MQNFAIHGLHDNLGGNCKVIEFIGFVTIYLDVLLYKTGVCYLWDFTNTRRPLEKIPAIVAQCPVTFCSYYTKSFCTYIHTYILAYSNKAHWFLLSLPGFLCAAVSFYHSKNKFSEVHLLEVSGQDLHCFVGNDVGNSSSVSVFTLHQDLLINKDVFSTEGQEESSSPLTVACRGWHFCYIATVILSACFVLSSECGCVQSWLLFLL